MIKIRMRWTGHVACIEDKKCAYRGNLRDRDLLEDLILVG
jgi:hypothetical protein